MITVITRNLNYPQFNGLVSLMRVSEASAQGTRAMGSISCKTKSSQASCLPMVGYSPCWDGTASLKTKSCVEMLALLKNTVLTSIPVAVLYPWKMKILFC
jgi:hypothetical protein